MTIVTRVTSAAERADDLTDQDYRDIYAELREQRSLANFVQLAQSAVSRSWWSQYEAGGKHLDWQRRNELRRAVGLPELAPSVAAATAEVAPDAAVWRVGAGLPDTVILVAPNRPDGLLLSVNGDVHIVRPVDAENAKSGTVTPVTLQPGTRSRKPAHRPYIADEAKWLAYLAWSAAWESAQRRTPEAGA